MSAVLVPGVSGTGKSTVHDLAETEPLVRADGSGTLRLVGIADP
ncbi:hypothetical protein [Pseudonocardia sp.]|nr:hypothetical protein [Pseudonocardia sp.]